jgi:hypothetical protein
MNVSHSLLWRIERCSLYHHEKAIDGPGIAVHTSHLDGPVVVVWPESCALPGHSGGVVLVDGEVLLESSEWYFGLVRESPSSHGKNDVTGPLTVPGLWPQ